MRDGLEDQGPAHVTGKDAPGPEAKAVRLPGLWVICASSGALFVFLGLTALLPPPRGMNAFRNPMAEAFHGLLAVVVGAVTLGLWFRSDSIRRVAMGLLTAFAFLLVFALVRSPTPWSWAASLLGWSLAVLVYLWLRRGHFCAGWGTVGPRAGAAPACVLMALVVGAILALWYESSLAAMVPSS